MNTAEDEESGPQREQWASGWDFFMAALAMTVGLGNIYRFPYTAYDNGGGAFLIPYVLVHILIGKPIYYMEACIGQFVSGGPVKVWALSPALKGKLTAGLLKQFLPPVICYFLEILLPTCNSVMNLLNTLY